uniref:Ig-like domain-containing protein n=1 Tax=Melopsittacus undulatus TaxID=13146 RepID=A0A8V5GLF8_MELUD
MANLGCSLPVCLRSLSTGVWAQMRVEETVWWSAGNTATLKCTYSSNASYVYVAWYRQRPGEPLQYLMQSKGRGGSYSHTAPFFRKRFSCRADKNSGTLFISGLELEDSALYYCALQGPQWEIPGGRLNNISFLLFSCSLLHVHRDHSPSPWQIKYAAAVEGRATMSWDNLQSKSSLSLHALQPQDSARYFCAVHTETGNPPEL